MAQSPGMPARSNAVNLRRGGITVLRNTPQIAHMKELRNYGSTSNRRYRIRRK